MPRDFTDALFERLLNAFPEGRAYAHPDFDQAAMPHPVAHFLGRRLRTRLDAEREAWHATRSDWVAYDHPDVHEQTQQLWQALAPHAQVPAGEWRDELRAAVEHAALFLIRPTHALVGFVFGRDDGALPTDAIQHRMDYFAAYPYLREAISAYIEQKQPQTIDRTRFTALLTRFDQQITADYTADDWLRLLEPLFDLAETAGFDGVPPRLLRTFFSAKDRAALAERLAREDAPLSRTALRRLLAHAGNTPSASETPSARPAEVTAPSSGDPSSGDEADLRRVADDAPAQQNGAVPRWKQFQGGNGSKGRSERAASPPPGGSGPRPAPERAAEASTAEARTAEAGPRPRWQQFQGAPKPSGSSSSGPSSEPAVSEPAVPASSAPAPASSGSAEAAPADPTTSADPADDLDALEADVLGPRGARNRAQFVRHLFSGSQTAYAQVLRRLRGAEDWAAASRIIAADVFRTNQVNIYSDPAVAFTEAVEARYRE